MRSIFIYITITSIILILSSCKSTPDAVSSQKIEYNVEELKKRTFNFFWETTHKDNFQVPDKYPKLTFSSIAATGFGLSSYIVGIENNYISRQEGAERVKNTLQVLWDLPQGSEKEGVSGFKGFYYHFLNTDDAKRFKSVELSSIDSGLLMAGVLSCMSYFDNNSDSTETQIRQLADSLYRRVDWTFMMKKNGKMSMGWHPEKGFIEADWAGYNEAMVLLIMAMGSPTHPIQDNAWSKWCETYPIDSFYGYQNVQFDPLFGHQYSHIWIDFKGIQDSFMRSINSDYFINSKNATLSNRAYCIANPSKFKGYNENVWGLTACNGPADKEMVIDGINRKFFSYRARGCASIQIVDDGTISPTAAGGSYAFTPQESEACLSAMWNTYYDNLIGEYGFKDAFNLTYTDNDHPNGWFDDLYLGIDQGPILLMIQNHQNGIIWETMKKNPYIIKGLQRAGFKGGWLE